MNGKKKRETERQKLKDSKSGRGLEMKNVYESGSRKKFSFAFVISGFQTFSFSALLRGLHSVQMSWGNRIRNSTVKGKSHGKEQEGEDEEKKWEEYCEILSNFGKGPFKYNDCSEDTKI